MLTALKCFILGHDYTPIRVDPYKDTSFSDQGVRSSTIVRCCDRCGHVKVTHEYGAGYLTLDDVMPPSKRPQTTKTKYK